MINLNLLKKAVQSGSHCQVKGGNLYAYCMKTHTQFKLKIDTEFEFTVCGIDFYNAINTKEQITIADTDSQIIVKNGRTKTKLKKANNVTVPYAPTQNAKRLEIDTEKLIKAFKLAKPFLTTEDDFCKNFTRFFIVKDGCMYATNNKAAIKINLDCAQSIKLTIPFAKKIQETYMQQIQVVLCHPFITLLI